MKNRQLQDLSNTDALTGLANRRYLDEYLATLRNSVINRKQPIAMLVVDVDFFKRYNDFYGHAMGDKVLQQVAIALQESTHRATDLICRYGGEEFVLVLENTSKEEAMVVAGNLCQAVEKLGIPHQLLPPVRWSLSRLVWR
ncbi:MAG: diguanylate cyclase [Shewanella fodinae]|nr:diguanylate cyclase [Shewanella fodinae]